MCQLSKEEISVLKIIKRQYDIIFFIHNKLGVNLSLLFSHGHYRTIIVITLSTVVIYIYLFPYRQK